LRGLAGAAVVPIDASFVAAWFHTLSTYRKRCAAHGASR
jgi:hypothetical protein